MPPVLQEETELGEALRLSTLSDSIPLLQSRLTGVPVELLRHIASFLAWPSVKRPFKVDQDPLFSTDLINLSSVSRALYSAFKRDRYRVVVLQGEQSSVEFVLFLLSDVEALRSVRQLVIESVCPLHDYETFARLISHLHHLSTFFYHASHGLDSSIVRALCSLQKRGRLETIYLGDASFESVTELAKNRSKMQGGPLSNLKVITLDQAPSSEWYELEDPSAEVLPSWLVDHPEEEWEAVEHDILHDLAMFLSRSSKTLEFLDLSLVPFYTSSYFSSDSPLRTMFFDHTKPKPSSTADELPPPRVLEFPLLKILALPSLDLASPVVMELLRTSPLLEHLFLTHEPTTANVGTSAIIEFPRLPKLLSLKLGSFPSSDEEERGSDTLMHVVESFRGSTSLETLDAAGASFVDGARVRGIVSSFPNLTSLSLLSPDWRCSMNEISSILSKLTFLHTFAFNLDPYSTDPPNPVPEANRNLLEDGELRAAEDFIGDIMDYLYADVSEEDDALGVGLLDRPTKDLQHFDAVVEKLATSVAGLRTVDWDFDELYSLVWEIGQGENGKVKVKGSLYCDELDGMAYEDELEEFEKEDEEEEEDTEEEDEWSDEIDEEEEEDEEEETIDWADVD